MSVANHTPGPWTIGGLSDDGGWQIEGPRDFPGYVLCSRPPWEHNAPQSNANAHLIAAAPKLLSLAERWAAIDGGAWHVDRHAAEKADLLSETRAAIAEARGEQP